MFCGVYTALITPFNDDGSVDFNSLSKLLELQCKSGVDGVVACGTTGESSTLSKKEHEEIIEFCVKEINGRIKVIAGTGSNSTDSTILFTKFATKAKCDAVLVVSPYYNKPTQNGLYLHYKLISDSTDIPIIIYNIPGRTSVNIEPDTIKKLFDRCNNIVAIKEASGSLTQMNNIKLITSNIELLSGDDILTLPILSIGGVGVISVLSNIIPIDIISIVNFFKNGNINDAINMHYKFLPLMKLIFIETNPIPIKAAASLLGICKNKLRLPMCEINEENKLKINNMLKELDIYKYYIS
jgi:4-hydroxy-tetrahydrodipicolinate synthase